MLKKPDLALFLCSGDPAEVETLETPQRTTFSSTPSSFQVSVIMHCTGQPVISWASQLDTGLCSYQQAAAQASRWQDKDLWRLQRAL